MSNVHESARAVVQMLEDITDWFDNYDDDEWKDENRERYEQDYSIDVDEYPDALDMINDHALSIEGVWRGRTKGEAELDKVIVVFTTGGPHVQAITDGRGPWDVEAWGWFGSERCKYSVNAWWLDSIVELVEYES